MITVVHYPDPAVRDSSQHGTVDHALVAAAYVAENHQGDTVHVVISDETPGQVKEFTIQCSVYDSKEDDE